MASTDGLDPAGKRQQEVKGKPRGLPDSHPHFQAGENLKFSFEGPRGKSKTDPRPSPTFLQRQLGIGGYRPVSSLLYPAVIIALPNSS